jgi:hypothetical protein
MEKTGDRAETLFVGTRPSAKPVIVPYRVSSKTYKQVREIEEWEAASATIQLVVSGRGRLTRG